MQLSLRQSFLRAHCASHLGVRNQQFRRVRLKRLMTRVAVMLTVADALCTGYVQNPRRIAVCYDDELDAGASALQLPSAVDADSFDDTRVSPLPGCRHVYDR